MAAQPHFAPNAEQNQVIKREDPWKQLVVPFKWVSLRLRAQPYLQQMYHKDKCDSFLWEVPELNKKSPCSRKMQVDKPAGKDRKSPITHMILSYPGDQGSTYGMFSHSSHKLLLWDCNQIKVTSRALIGEGEPDLIQVQHFIIYHKRKVEVKN